MFDGVLEIEPTSGIVVLLRTGLVTFGGDKCALDGGCTISTSILGRFRGGESTASTSGVSGRTRREFLRPYVFFIVAAVVVRIKLWIVVDSELLSESGRVYRRAHNAQARDPLKP
jgi:hypothetical protein